jgi:hypothetical protein
VCAKLPGEWPRGLYIPPKPCVQVAAEMRVLTDAKAHSEALVEQLGGQVEEAQVTSCPVSIFIITTITVIAAMVTATHAVSAVCSLQHRGFSHDACAA